MKNLIKTLVLSHFLAYCTFANASIVGPVNLLEQVNNGTRPVLCGSLSLNAVAGGIIEMALDLDQDGVVDVCLASGHAHCNAGFNFDASTHNGTLLSSQSGPGGSIMGATNLTLAFWAGQVVGPNFQAASGVTGSSNFGQTDQPLVFGFRGGSNTATTEYGMFSFTVDSTDCSITFGSVDYASGGNTYSNIVAAVVTTVAATPVPTLSAWALLILSALIGFISISKRNKKQI